MCDKAATAAQKAAPIAHVLLALCVSFCARDAFAQLSDPMAPPGMAPSGAGEAGRKGAPSELQAIISGPGRRLALIDGAVVQVGETIPGNGELLSLGADSAIVRSGEKNIQLRLHPDLKKGSAR
jgi:hypothetical protein